MSDSGIPKMNPVVNIKKHAKTKKRLTTKSLTSILLITIIIYGGIPMKYVCNLCGYVYDEAAGDPDNGIAPGTKWEDVPEDWVCPLCGAGKEEFSQE